MSDYFLPGLKSSYGGASLDPINRIHDEDASRSWCDHHGDSSPIRDREKRHVC